MNDKYSFKFSKTGEMIYISHLDLLRLFARAARRADLPVALTQGYNPRFKIRVNRALKLGVSSDNEEGEFVLNEKIGEGQLKERWQAQLPSGIEIKEIKFQANA